MTAAAVVPAPISSALHAEAYSVFFSPENSHASTATESTHAAPEDHQILQLMSTGQIIDHDCRVILVSDSCCVQDRRTGTLLGASPRRRDSQRLWELDWLHLLFDVSTCQLVTTLASVFVASSTTSFAR